MPNRTAQITGAYTSKLKYKQYDCDHLVEKLNVIAQEQGIKTSKVQAFWWRFGQSDGIEASEISVVRGEKEAVRKAVDVKHCGREEFW